MTIRKGVEWGRVGPAPADLVVARDDRDLFRILNGADAPSEVGVRTGDLVRTLGAPAGRQFAPGENVVITMIDVGVAIHDGGRHRFAAHAVARRSWWRGPVRAAFNAEFRGTWDVAPKSHPNDGFLDIVEVDASMTARQRWTARGRLPTASHLPHPAIRTKRARMAAWAFERPMTLWLDGVRVGRTRTLQVGVEPDALTVCV